jgi:ribonuclease BN (tRNA processing enzyme)
MVEHYSMRIAMRVENVKIMIHECAAPNRDPRHKAAARLEW